MTLVFCLFPKMCALMESGAFCCQHGTSCLFHVGKHFGSLQELGPGSVKLLSQLAQHKVPRLEADLLASVIMDSVDGVEML